MDIVRVNSISVEHLSAEDLEFLENTDSNLFVALAEGDASSPYAIDKEQTWDLEALVNDSYTQGYYVSFSGTDGDCTKVVNALQEAGWTETKSFFSGDRYFAPA